MRGPDAAAPEPATWSSDVPITTPDAVRTLHGGELQIVGRIAEASNTTFFCELRASPDASPLHAIYKPIRGERPLDDFPSRTLAMREASAWLVSEATGWRIVPPTVLRDGPAGRGMVQLWIDVDESADVLEMILTRDARLRRIALLDAVINNADRKGGHLLPTATGEVHGCDHGVCFSAEPKLRTVLWGWRGEPLEADEVAMLGRLAGALDRDLRGELTPLLAREEIEATCRRVDRLLRDGRMPVPDPYRHVIPWPPF
jgi:uncharacterized repeat protein (TIGR03843 family)